jgi:hypothetical protein
MSRERALELHGQLCAGIGEGARISGRDYQWLMDHRHHITPEEKAEYITRIVRFLRTSLAVVPLIPNGKKNAGDRIEHFLGIPQNNSETGDLYGLELKALNVKGGDSLTLKSVAILTTARIYANENMGCNYPSKVHSVVYYPDYKFYNSPWHARPRYLCKNGEVLRSGEPSQYGRMMLSLDNHDILRVRIRTTKSNEWSMLDTDWNLRNAFSKFELGTILVWFRERRPGSRINILDCIVLPNLTTQRMLDDFRSGVLGYEIRFKGRSQPRSTGAAFRYSRTQLDGFIFDEEDPRNNRSHDWTCPVDLFSDPTNGITSETSTLGDSQGQQ